jgi:type II secretory pathway component GspD/PulD (secretin)
VKLEHSRKSPVLWSIPFVVVLLCIAHVPAWGQSSTDGALISLDADSTSVNGILEILAERSGLNIVTSPEVQARKISIHLRNTPFDEALNLVVRAAGLGYERVGNSILVADVQKLSTQTGFVTRVFELKHAYAADVAELLEVISKDVIADVPRNRVVMRASQSNIEQAEAIIEQLDTKQTQILLEARLIEVNTSALLEVGIDWEKILRWETAVTEGYQGSSDPGQVPQTIDFTKVDETYDWYRQMASFEIALEAMITDGTARLLSNAKLVTLDNVPAEIFAGETVPVVITSLQGAAAGGGGVLQTVQLEKIDVGVKLDMTPRVTGPGLVTVLVEPEVSRIVAFVGPDDDLPQTSNRRARTLVRVRDGQKIYLGGLLTEEERNTQKKVPLLGDIPLLGQLFRHHRIETIRQDLFIEITPRIVGDEGAGLPVAPALEETEVEP